MRFEWDPEKGAENVRKHGVSFDEAASVFFDEFALSGPDHGHSIGESRYVTFGISRLGRLLAVSHTYRPGTIRIINGRRATRVEKRLYEEEG